jgi:hypothetical protein
MYETNKRRIQMAKDDVKEKGPSGDPAGAETDVQGLNPQWLKGLTYRGTTAKPVEEDGRKKVTYVTFERPLEAGDVLDWKDKGTTVVIVTKDGRKYSVSKKAGK